MDERRAVLDTDFINGITAYRAGDPADLFCRLMTALGRDPVIHAFVADELVHNPAAQTLISEDKLTIVSPVEILSPGDCDAIELYHNSFEDMYEKITGSRLPPGLNIFTRHGGMSFGEIHSILMAAELGIPLFYSNDGGAKRAANYYACGRLTVYNAEEVAEALTGSDQITGAERKFVRNVYRRSARERQNGHT